jgi:hypothetical protein
MSGREQLSFDINRSKQLILLLCCIHGFAIFSLVLLSLHPILVIVASSLVVFSLSYSIKKSREIICITARADNDWFIQDNNGTGFYAGLSGQTYISDWLTLLVFNSIERSSPIRICILKDSVSMNTLSQLKSHLKISSYQIDTSCHNNLST